MDIILGHTAEAVRDGLIEIGTDLEPVATAGAVEELESIAQAPHDVVISRDRFPWTRRPEPDARIFNPWRSLSWNAAEKNRPRGRTSGANLPKPRV